MQTNPPWGKKYEWDNGSAGDCRKSIGSTWDRPNFAKDWFLHDNKAPVHKCVKFWLIAMWIDRGAPTWLLVFFFFHTVVEQQRSQGQHFNSIQVVQDALAPYENWKTCCQWYFDVWGAYFVNICEYMFLFRDLSWNVLDTPQKCSETQKTCTAH